MLSEAAMRNLRLVANRGLIDTCVRLVYAPGSGDYGYGPPTYTQGATLPCLFKPRTEQDANGSVLMVDADIYLERNVTLLPNDRVRITHLHGDAMATPQTYAIVGGPVQGKTLLHAELQLVTDGS